MSRLKTPALDDLPAGPRQILDKVGAQLGFVPNMFKTIASNPTVLEVVTSLQATMSRVLDARTRHSIALAASQVASELKVATVWSWGWAAYNPAGQDPDKAMVACTYLWTRAHALCDAPTMAGASLDTSLDVGATLPPGTICLLGKTKLLANDVAGMTRLTGDREVAFSAGFQHAVLAAARRVDAAEVTDAERTLILDRFGGSRAAYTGALAKARVSQALARTVLADELRRRSVEKTLHIATPTPTQLQAWFDTHADVKARMVRIKGVTQIVLAPADRVFALAPNETAKIDGVKVTALGDVAPLGTFAYALAAKAVRTSLVGELKDDAFATWIRRRENQSLTSLACTHDVLPQPATIDLTDWAPFLALG